MFPHFEVSAKQEEPGAVLGSVSTTDRGTETWVADGHIGYLMHDATLIEGRWRRRGQLWTFVPDYAGQTERILGRQMWSVIDSYWGERAELVLDQSREWRRTRFEPTDAIRFEGTGGTLMAPAARLGDVEGEAVEAGWDHEHCAICWETIGPAGQPEAYLSLPDTRACERCYREFITCASLDFVQTV